MTIKNNKLYYKIIPYYKFTNSIVTFVLWYFTIFCMILPVIDIEFLKNSYIFCNIIALFPITDYNYISDSNVSMVKI